MGSMFVAIIFIDCCFTSLTNSNVMAVGEGMLVRVAGMVNIQLSGLLKQL